MTSSSSSTTSTTTAFYRPTLYVATDGNDAWSGTLPSPNAAHTDGPLATLSKAQALVRGIKGAQSPPSMIVVEVENGTYFLTSALTFTSADSGTPTTQIVYESAPGSTAVISGGKDVTGWSRVSGNEWKASANGFQYFEQLWLNNQVIYRPRTTSGYLYFAGTVYSNYKSASCPVQSGTQYECFNRFQFKSGDLASTYYDLNNVEIDNFECWTMPRMRLASIDIANNTAYTTGETTPAPQCHGFITGHRYLVENVKEALSQVGQWYLDQPNNQIFYMAAQGENPNSESFVAPQLTQLIVANGLSYVTFQGLTFSNSNWVVPPQGWQSPQGEELSANNYVPAAVSFAGSSYITITNSVVSHIGNYAIAFYGTGPFQPTRQSPYSNQITNSEIFDSGAGGIVIGRVPFSTDTDASVAQYDLIENNQIAGMGRFLPGGYAIYVMDAHNNMVSHNTIHDIYSNAISVGATYGYNLAVSQYAHDNTVEFNLCYDVNQGVAEDGGAIYTASGAAQGNKILNNVVHDVTADINSTVHGYGGWGIYFDSTSQNVYSSNNLVYRTSFPSIHQNDGFNNTVTNSILAYGNFGLIDRSHNNASSLTVTHNILLWDINSAQGSVQRGIWTCVATCTSQFLLADNLYWYLNGTPTFITTNGDNPAPIPHTLAQWQALGEDVGTIIANPLFADASYPTYNFALASNSPAFGVGFVAFDPSQAGVIPGSTPAPPSTPPAFPLQLLNSSTGF